MKNTTVKLIADYVNGNPIFEGFHEDIVDESRVRMGVAYSIGDVNEITSSIGENATVLVGSLLLEEFITKEDYSDLRARLPLGTYHWFKELSYLEGFVGETNVGKFVEEYIKSKKK